jgi:hypothetical protein
MHGYAVWLTLVCVLFEWLVLYLSLGMSTEMLLPAKALEGRDFWASVFEGGIWTWDDVLAYAAAVAILEPFYVAAGFALYLNRRSSLEGWDIEVALRRIAERHAAAVATVLFCFLAALVYPTDSLAQQKDPRKEIAEVLKGPEFPHEVDSTELRYTGKGWNWGGNKEGVRELIWLAALRAALAGGVRDLLWVAIGAIVAYAIWRAARLLPRGPRVQPEPYRPPEAMFGMELAPETLPPDVAAAAARLAAEGKLREALGLLYRGALSVLIHKRGVMLLASHTENEVLSLSPGENKPYLKNLIELWRQCAYARRTPQRAQIDELAQAYRAFAA